jgi:PKD repeat protein
MKRLAGLVVLVMLASQAFPQQGWRTGEMEVRVFLHSREEASKLKALHLDDEPASPDGSEVSVYATPPELMRIRNAGLRYSVSVPDLNAHSREMLEGKELLGYYNYTTIVALADSLAANFPAICKKTLLGTSVTGKQLGILKISDNVNVNEDEPEVLFEGGIHGDELMGPEVVIRYARDLCLGYGTDSLYTDLVNTREIWMYYVVNPDGYASMSRYNGNGVDINRDCGYMWNAEGNSPGAFSQPETKVVRDLQLGHNFVIFTDYHGGSEVIAYPWSYKTEPAPDMINLGNLAATYSDLSGYVYIPYGQGYNIMYQIFGSTKDNDYGPLGQAGWSIEITSLKQPPSTQIGMYYGFNVPSITEMIRRAGWGIEGVVTDSITGSPVKAQVWADNFFPCYTDPAVGDYHKYVLPGPHTVMVTASGYLPKTISGVIVPSQGSIVNNFRLVHDPGHYAYKVIASRIPNYPTAGSYLDESYTPGAIGAPDSITYSLGKNGWIILDLGDTLLNGTGNDLKIWESGSTPEGYTCSVSLGMDGPWSLLGTGTGSQSFDLGPAAVSRARFVKITDDGDGNANIPDAGFDLDAVQLLTPPLLPDFIASITDPCSGSSVSFTDESTGNATGWDWAFPGGTPGTSTSQNPSGIVYATPGIYDVTLTISNTAGTGTLTKTSLITVLSPPGIPSKPVGPQVVCQSEVSVYTTSGNDSTIQYIWALAPAGAGTLAEDGMTCMVIWDTAFTSEAYLKVKALNACGESVFSDSLSILVRNAPQVNLGPDTIVCLPDSMLLDAGNLGCTYLWSTGATTKTIWASAGTPGDITYSVEVKNHPENCTASDEIILSFLICSSVPDRDGEDLVRISPNPSDGRFLVSTGKYRNVEYQVVNSLGKLILAGVLPGEQASAAIDLSSYPSGLYLVTFRDRDRVFSSKLLKR